MKHTWNIRMAADGTVISTVEIPAKPPVERTIQVTEDTIAKAIKVAETIWAGALIQ
jgi:hypothetical protein